MKVEEIDEVLEEGTDAMKVKRVFGEPITQNGITLIPVAKVRGGFGGGSGEGPDAKGKGWGAAFGVSSRALGTYVIKGESVRFVPAIDVNQMFTVIGVMTVAALFAVVRPLVRDRHKA